MAVIRGFRGFLLRGNVIDLAVGVVIGAAFNSVVQALVRDFVTPLIEALGGHPDSHLLLRVGGATFLVGDFINNALSFLIVAAVVYFFVVAPFTRLADRFMPKPHPAPMRDCPQCLANVPQAARKCMYCTSELTPLARR